MMEPISDDLVEFLRRRIGSLEELECLLLLRRTGERRWASFEIARELGIPESMVDATVVAMQASGLIAADGDPGAVRWRYQPRAPEIGRLVEELARVYEERRLEVLRILSAQAMTRLRGSAARAFADAFVIGRKKNDG